MDIAFTAIALRQMKKFHPQVRAQIEAKIERYAATGGGKVKTLQGRPETVLRVGDWRVIFTIEGDTMFVREVGNRREIYD